MKTKRDVGDFSRSLARVDRYSFLMHFIFKPMRHLISVAGHLCTLHLAPVCLSLKTQQCALLPQLIPGSTKVAAVDR